ncbi:MAG: YgiQ family radical SAM protein, partial [Rikenellaceae bacterium]
DSMVNHYTATKRLRSDDAYTAGGKAGARPDYPTLVYTRILKELYPSTPVILGGIEASLRRVTHYDYWQDRLRPSFLIESGADAIVYGMGEKPMVEITRAIERGEDWRGLKQVVYLSDNIIDGALVMNSYEECLRDKKKFGENFVILERESNKMHAVTLVEPYGDRYLVVNPPHPYLTQSELDSSFDLPYTRLPHPRYKDKLISAYEMIKFSVNIHRGCFGGCSFCTISAHQGKHISSRSERSVLTEVKAITKLPNFKGNLSDVGGPSANMWQMRGRDLSKCEKCQRPSCIYPSNCPNLNNDHVPLLKLYDKIEKVEGVKRFYIGSGIRYDMFDRHSNYLERVITRHVSGRFKVAPEHTEDRILTLMRKPSFGLFEQLTRTVAAICQRNSMRNQIVPYFISSHPGCTLEDMKRLSARIKKLDSSVHIESVQDFTPTPMTLSSAMYYIGENPYTGEKLYIERERDRKNQQKECFYTKKSSGALPYRRGHSGSADKGSKGRHTSSRSDSFKRQSKKK